MEQSALRRLLIAVLLAGLSSVASAADQRATAGPKRNAYFGDLHLHTSLSFDAFVMDERMLPEDSYRYAQGEPVEYLGQQYKRNAPLDFLAVTDHAEFLGAFARLADPNGPHAGSEAFKTMHNPDSRARWALLMRLLADARQKKDSPEVKDLLKDTVVQGNWRVVIDAAEKYYKPGTFTTFVAYEWSSTPGGQNLHRNVIFRGPKYPPEPFSSIESQRPEDLWAYIEKNRTDGVQSLAIPHNSNLSNGLMFDYKDSDGKPITREYAETRLRNEPVIELSQQKGTSETHPTLSPTDEFANFEIYERLFMGGGTGKVDGSYARQAYARGLEIAAKVGANPYKFGLVGATDLHSGMSSTEENNFPGVRHMTGTNAKELFSETSTPETGVDLVHLGVAGLTGVWADANTREAIFDALKRKEVFATSGNRIKVRLFAGWNYPKDLIRKPDWVQTAYNTGVPMGADLPVVAAGKAPRFVVQAIKDPNAGNLDRIQIVKVWHQDGQSHETIFDVVWSGKRSVDPKTGKLPPVGNTVNPKTATYTNSIGATELSGVWEDPRFNAAASAVYYARVLEIPTPRWTTYWAVRAKLPLPQRFPAWIQERAWTSPIFYKAS